MNPLKAPKGKIVVWQDQDSKDSHTFENGQKIIIKRRYNNLNYRETQPVNAWVVDADGIPAGAEVLCHHNANHDSYRLFDYQDLSGEEAASSVWYFGVPEDQVYLWRVDGGEWQPLKGFATCLKLFRPYSGFLIGIEPKKINNAVLLTSGEFKGRVCNTVRSAEYEIIYMGSKGQEERILRLRHFEGDYENEREELTALRDDLTREMYAGKIHVGLTTSDAKRYQPNES